MKIKSAILFLAFALPVNGGAFAHQGHDEINVASYQGPVQAVSGRKLKVVATTTTFASLVRSIGGDRVDVKSISLPKFNTHFFQPKFSDVRNVQKADLFVQAGLDHELWTDAILEAAGKPKLFRGAENNVQMSEGIKLLDVPQGNLSRVEGDVHIFGNPHIWMSPENARVMALNLLARLKAHNPENASYFEENAKAFLEALDRKIQEWKQAASIVRGKEVISYHKDIAYFADFMGFQANRFYEPKPGIPPTPRDLISIENYMKEKGIKAMIQPVYYSRESTDALAKRTGAKVYIICQNAGEIPGTEDYINLFDYNVKTISEALR
jgi:zinc/manganese transport system substrate-binding protein